MTIFKGEQLTASWTVSEHTVAFGEHETWVRISKPKEPMPGAFPVIVLHGGPGMGHNYMLPFEQLAATGRTVVHYDQIGCGNSTHLPDADPSVWTPDLFVKEFFNLIEALGFEQYHVIGQSWGGMLTAEIAVRRPAGLQSLGILNSPASMELWIAGAAELRALLPDGMDDTMRNFEAEERTDAPEYLVCVDEFYRRHVCQVEPSPPELTESNEQMEADPTVYHTMNGPNEFHVIGSMRDWSIIDRLSEIDRPTLVLAGEHDEATPATWQPFVQGIDDVRQAVITDASHCSHLEQPEIVMGVVGDFLAKHDA